MLLCAELALDRSESARVGIDFIPVVEALGQASGAMCVVEFAQNQSGPAIAVAAGLASNRKIAHERANAFEPTEPPRLTDSSATTFWASSNHSMIVT